MTSPRDRRGFTLLELLVSMVVTAILAAGLLRMIMGDMRFAEDREAWRTARQAARSGLTVLTSELRMVETGAGVESAVAGGQDLTVRAPYGLGVLCSTNGATSTVTLLPSDSTMFAQPGHSGFGWRNDTTEVYTYVPAGTVTTGASSAPCTAAGITLLAGTRVATLGGGVPATLPSGTVFLLYRRIRYEIKASVAMPGRLALWRTVVTTGGSEELAAPYDSTARFRFYVATATTAQDAVPSPLSTITGLELAFAGRSDRTPRGEAGPKVVPFTNSIFFHNRTP